MRILGIESSCDETAAAVVENGRKILSSAVFTQIQQHRPFGGVVPEIASRSHCEAIVPVVREAVEKAGLTYGDIDGIAVTCAPGLIGALLVGVNFAKGLALSLKVPLIPVNHTRGHIALPCGFRRSYGPGFCGGVYRVSRVGMHPGRRGGRNL